MNTSRLPPALVEGEQVRLTPDDTWHEVVRVSPGAAYVQALYASPQTVTLVDKHGKERVFTASRSTRVEAISVHSFVYERRAGKDAVAIREHIEDQGVAVAGEGDQADTE